MAAAPARQSAEARRVAVCDASIEEFALGGLAGTSTQAIADRAGISQPYLFRLFPTKKALFIAAVDRCHRRIIDAFEQAVGDATGEDALERMGDVYAEMIANRTFLLMQLQTYASCEDEEVQAAARRGFRDIWYTIERLSGVDPDAVREFYATGMLWNVVTAMKLDDIDERWAKLACPLTPEMARGAQK